jgi:lytic murein transglycosylase
VINLPAPLRSLLAAAALLASADHGAAAGPYDAPFRQFLADEIGPEARAAGVSAATVTRELAGLLPDTALPGLGRPGVAEVPPEVNYQAEFRAPERYFRDELFVSLARIGRGLIAKHAGVLDAVEARYGVPRRIVMAIWGRESAYGGAKIPHDAIQVLATRAFMGPRAAFFRGQLIDALKMLDAGAIERGEMKSSWGGALGQPQFLPSNWLAYAVDFDGDGHRDIWGSVPDTLGSIANYLNAHGWQDGRDWGYEVRVPDGVSCAREGPDRAQPISAWTAEGIGRVSGRPFPDYERDQPGYLLMPAGRYGPAFIATGNFEVLKSYNKSDTYALFVGHLADRYSHDGGFAGQWKRAAPVRRGEVRDRQLELEAAGHDVGGADGLVGYKTRRAIGAAQAAAGRPATCWIG